ncbi:Malate dehydrogenase (oxaloacetate-decarboxylating) [Thermosinus carboxydivorans Nor1]|uniref:Malate dehydrogenase (Oxaloacetate-decarboxylating) n=1 Tax=Thermosinus carboxydivorans Nor1 TaxID=401526 RepID=A1HQH1_9FIRM|nr:NADP-dependent malic enzyme [Thermosinus carboxydivorans]EAX47777.1 Malate dehydrogenase (oxaloacetate-decarboxylating) [Thermosinus carboxydivorans Nor1]
MNVREEAMKLHREYQGKLGVTSKVPLRDKRDLSLAYTPGVAEPCKEIKINKDLSFELTCRGNLVAVVTDGTRVLGLGDIGPEAAMPVMEGKCVLFKVFGDVDAVPICLDTKDPDKIIETVKLLQPSFAGINLEDLSSPKCYDIEDRLKEQMDIPVFHDDQHGTAIAALSALIGALRFVKKDLKTAKIVVNGVGAAGSAIGRLLVNAGAENVIMVDVNGALYDGMPGLNRIQQQLARTTNKQGLRGNLAEVAQGADALIGVSAPGAFTKEIIQSMAKDPIVFAMANPVPEIMYDEAKAAGAKVAGTGRSDAPNQVNNVTVFPGVFRGALDVRARQINEEMKIAAAYAIADLISEDELREDYVVPDAFDPRVAPAVAAAVARVAMETGVARIKVDPEEVRAKTAARVKLGK